MQMITPRKGGNSGREATMAVDEIYFDAPAEDAESHVVSTVAQPVAAAFPAPKTKRLDKNRLIDLLHNTVDVFAVKDVDWVLLMAKCSVPALFVVFSAALAIPLNEVMGDAARTATEQFAAGALIVTWGFELTPGYKLKMPGGKKLSPKLVVASFLGSFVAGTVFAASQEMWPYGETSGGNEGEDDSPKFGDSISFMIAFFVDGVVLANDAVETKCNTNKPLCQRIRPALTVLTLVVSIDNGVDGIGMYQQLDTDTMPAICYYIIFVGMIYLGGIFTLYIQKINSTFLHSFWFAFGAFAILDAGMQLATEGLTTAVLGGFLFVWGILCLGGDDEEDEGED